MSTKRKRTGGRLRKRVKIYSELVWIYGAFCWYCGARVTEVNHHVDHIIPRSRGGTDEIQNLALACSFCNCAKQAKRLEEFLAWLEFVRGPEFKSQVRDRLARVRISTGPDRYSSGKSAAEGPTSL